MNTEVGVRFDEDDVNEQVAWEQNFQKSKIRHGMQYAGLRDGAVPQNRVIKYTDFVNTSKLISKAGTRTSTTDEFASSTNYSTTSGNLPIFPIWVMPGIEDVVLLEHPVYAMMPKRAHRGKFVDWNKRTARGSASFKYEDPGMEPTKDTRGRSTIEIKKAYSIRRVSNFDIAVNTGWIDELATEINSATEALLDLLEAAIISGDASTYTYEYSGFNTLITTNTENQATAELTLNKIEDAVQWASQGAKTSIVGTGKPNIHITNGTDYKLVKRLLRPYLRANDTNNLNWGLESYMLEGRPVITSPKASITAGSRRWYILDMRKWFIAMLQDITYQELPQDADSRKFMLKTYQALTCLDETKNAMLYGIGA